MLLLLRLNNLRYFQVFNNTQNCKVKRFLFLLFFISFCKYASGQDIGFHFGVNFSNQSQKNIPKNLPEYKEVSGIRIGVDLIQKISKNLNVMSGIAYNQKGANRDWDFKETGFIFKIRNNLDYIDVPISILVCNTDRKAAPYISFGAYASLLVSGKTPSPSRLDPTEIFRKNDFGIKLCSGLKVDQFWFDISYDLGLANINIAGGEFIIKNKNWGLAIRYFPKF
jgi:hypothetical protein